MRWPWPGRGDIPALVPDGLRTSRDAPTPLAAAPILADVFHQAMFRPA